MATYEQFTLGFSGLPVHDQYLADVIQEALRKAGFDTTVHVGQGRAINGMPAHHLLFERLK